MTLKIESKIVGAKVIDPTAPETETPVAESIGKGIM